MNTYIKPWLLVLLILSPTGNAVSENIAVIVNPAVDASSIDNDKVKMIYMGQSTELTPYDQPEGTPVREAFYETAVGRSSRQVKALWAKLVFSGRAEAPQELINSKALKSTVAGDPAGIGYIKESEVDETVKVLMVLESEE